MVAIKVMEVQDLMSLSDKDYGRIQAFYQQSLGQFGHSDARSVRWGNLHDQQKRFAVLSQVMPLHGKSVLDVGSGLGDLYKYFLKQGIEVDYTGIDIVREFVEVSQAKYPQATFLHQDIFEVKQRYDVVICSGGLSFKVKDNLSYYQDMIRVMYGLAKQAVSFNMLDNRIHSDDDTYAAYSPLEIADFCDTVASRVQIVTDYLPQDFTIYMYKQ